MQRFLFNLMESVVDYLQDESFWGNQVLYDMCSERPLHIDRDTVYSKIWIIGRAYSATIERKAKSGFDVWDVVDALIESKIDSKISELNTIERPTNDNLEILLDAHNYLSEIFLKTTGLKKRSLASKYLHFHSPKSVFIFDSIANREVRKAVDIKRFTIPKNFDIPYAEFCVRCIHYRDTALEKNLGGLVTPRRLDIHLMGYGVPE